MRIVPMNVRQMRRHWDKLGKADPLWAVLTDPGKTGGGWRTDEFFETGRVEIRGIMDYVDRLHWPLRKTKALDFGCGVGRLSQALSDHFEMVVGVDISQSMIEQAERFNRKGPHCVYRVNTSDNLSLFADNEFDMVYSSITLQHIDPIYVRGYLREMVRVLSPGGVLIFQLPGARVFPGPGAPHRPAARRTACGPKAMLRDAAPHAWKMLSTFFYTMRETFGNLRRAVYYRYRIWVGRPVIQMHGMPRAEVELLLREVGARVVDVVEDASAGPGWTGYRYCATKGQSAA